MSMETKPQDNKTKYTKWVSLALIGILLIGIGVALFGFIIPFHSARSAMPAGGTFVIEQQPEGNLMLTWPEADRADYYCVEVLVPAQTEDEEPELVYRDYIEDATSCLLPELPPGITLTLRVRSVVDYKSLGGEQIRFGEAPLEVTTVYTTPVITDFQWEADPDNNTVTIRFQTQDGDHVRFYLLDEAGNVAQTRHPGGNELVLTFGDGADYPMPAFGEEYHMALDAYREEPGVRFYGYRSAELCVVRDDLLGRNLNLKCTDNGYNVYTLTWDETKGEHYEVQVMNDDTRMWETVSRVEGDGERSYTSTHLPVFREFAFRVVAVGGQTMGDSEFAAVSEEISFVTGESPIYTTVWPTKDLKAYTDSAMTEEAGKVKTGTAYCVLEERDGMFGIRLDGKTVYIDSNYCLINLPEYLGDLCSYEITNSYSSIYMVHEFEIPKVTGVVTGGYEKVRLKDGSFLVPLLYPTAQKLAVAAQAAVEEGYRLKIYDAFRPNKATREIYNLTNSILDGEFPAEPYTNVSISRLNLPEPQVVTPAETSPEGEVITEEVKKLTYRMVMCGSKYSLSYFLAKGGSLHNLGIAVDLTLEDLDSGEELRMQTSMHDLSQYSVLGKNNSAAKKLAAIMKGAGFGDLISEWWHFQDNEARKELAPPSVYSGVTASCWMADDTGWRYRTQKGTYYADETVTIDNVEYRFDEKGYVITGNG